MSGAPQPFMGVPPPPISPNHLAPSTLEPHLRCSRVPHEERDGRLAVREHPAPYHTLLPLACCQLAAGDAQLGTNRALLEPSAPTRLAVSPGAVRAPLPLYPQPPIPYPSFTLPSPPETPHTPFRLSQCPPLSAPPELRRNSLLCQILALGATCAMLHPRVHTSPSNPILLLFSPKRSRVLLRLSRSPSLFPLSSPA